MPKIRWIEIQGFRAFGATRRRFEFSTNLQLIWGPNSQGKTSVAEAFEFLLTGRTVRRDLMGSAKAEFNACLRNVHLPAGTSVYVAASIEDDAGVVHEVSRTLLSDYTAQDDCTSALTIDGQPAQDLSSLSIRLSEPPLQAPILMQHTIRFVVSARPQERADYFKAVLEIHDLEAVREEISDLLVTLDVPTTPIIQKLRRCASIPGFGPTSRSIEENALIGSALEAALAQGLASALAASGIPTADLSQDVTGRVAALRSVMTARREATFPLAALLPGSRTDLAFSEPALVGAQAFADAARQVAEEVGKLGQLFQAVLALPHVAGVEHPVDCPVCETPRALTPARVTTIRAHVENLADFEQKRRAAQQELAELRRAAQTVNRSAQSMLPEAARWDETGRQTSRAAVAEFLPEQGAQDYDRFLGSLDNLRAKISAAEAKFSDFLTALTAIESEVGEGRVVDVNDVRTSAVAYGGALEEVGRARDACQEAVGALVRPLREEIDRRANIVGWEDLVHVAEGPGLLAEGLIDQRARAIVRGEIEDVIEAIDQAKADVFDEKFRALSGEIGRWWSLLRPDDLVAFGGVRRRGTGRRFVDFKAILRAASGADPVERDAVGVLSDSQLNCLGLAAFLARCTSESSAVVLLDDPALASDEEYRTTFARYVVEELLRGTQVIIATYDEKLSRLVEDYYKHIPPDVFSVTMSDPIEGPVVTRTSNTLESMLAQAQPYLRSQSPEVRKMGAGRLREAAERLCKEIIVEGRRSEGRGTAVADFDRKNLGQLAPDVEPYLTDLSHPGKLRAIARILNPGSHDDAVPVAADLRVAHGDIQELKRTYLR